MNIVLLEASDWRGESRVKLNDRRHQHLVTILKVKPGDSVRVGALNGCRGTGMIVDVTDSGTTLDVTLDVPPLPRHPHTLVLALPRPKMLRRVLRTCAEFGVADLHLIHSARVEKSFWQSPLLSDHKVQEALLAGLERSGDTLPPKVVLHRRFRPFVEDVLPGLADSRPITLAHPGPYQRLRTDTGNASVVMVGPEGGFVPFELDLAQNVGAEIRCLGGRILSVDTAVSTVLARELH